MISCLKFNNNPCFYDFVLLLFSKYLNTLLTNHYKRQRGRLDGLPSYSLKIILMKAREVLADLKRRFPNEPEYHQAVEEVLNTIEEVYSQNIEFEKSNLIERLCLC